MSGIVASDSNLVQTVQKFKDHAGEMVWDEGRPRGTVVASDSNSIQTAKNTFNAKAGENRRPRGELVQGPN